MRPRSPRILCGLVAALVIGAGVAAPQAAAQDNPYERGPDPTESSIEASREIGRAHV